MANVETGLERDPTTLNHYGMLVEGSQNLSNTRADEEEIMGDQLQSRPDTEGSPVTARHLEAASSERYSPDNIHFLGKAASRYPRRHRQRNDKNLDPKWWNSQLSNGQPRWRAAISN